MNIFKWVLCTYDRWYFIEYENKDSFVGWLYVDMNLQFYSTSNFKEKYSKAELYSGGKNTEITKNNNLKKDQWSSFLTRARREFPKKMIKDIL